MTSDRKPDATTLTALTAFKTRLDRRYRERLAGFILFGSRARGTHRPDSDADVAVFLRQADDPIADQMDLADDTYAVFLDTGVMIQPWVFRGTPEQPDTTRAVSLLHSVQEDGIPL